MKDKNNNLNTQSENVAKKPKRAYDDYECVFSFKRKPVNPAFIAQLADRLREWSLKDSSLRISDFYDAEGIHPDDYYRWLKNYPALKTAHQFTMRRIASRREIGAAKKQLDGNFIARTLGWYCPDFKSEQERLANLKVDADGNASQNITVVIPPQQPTGRVEPNVKKQENLNDN